MYWGKKNIRKSWINVEDDVRASDSWRAIWPGESIFLFRTSSVTLPPGWALLFFEFILSVDLLPHVHLNFSIRELWIMTVFEMGELRRIQVFYSHLTQVRMPARGSNLKRKERKGGNEKESIFRNTNCKEDVISGYYPSCKSWLLSLVIFRKGTVIAPKSPPSIACQETLQITPPNFTGLQKEKKKKSFLLSLSFFKSFDIISALQKSCESSTKIFQIPFTQIPQMLVPFYSLSLFLSWYIDVYAQWASL